MRYVFFVNPTAGKGDSQNGIISSIKKHFSNKIDNVKIHITNAVGDAMRSAKKEAETGDKIRMFACGGEGTVFEVLNGIIGHKNVELGVIPCGSANDFLKFFSSHDGFVDINAQIEGETVEMDVIKAGENYCLNGCSVGMDAMVANDMRIFKGLPLVSGPVAYKLAIAKTFLKKLGVSIKLAVDDGPFENIRCLFAVVANAPYYGGGYKAAPNAVPYDNKLDFTLVDVISKIKVLGFLPKYERGQHTDLSYCTLKECKSMEFISDKPIPVNLDGEIFETTHMRFELVKSAIKFVVPKGIKPKILTNV